MKYRSLQWRWSGIAAFLTGLAVCCRCAVLLKRLQTRNQKERCWFRGKRTVILTLAVTVLTQHLIGWRSCGSGLIYGQFKEMTGLLSLRGTILACSVWRLAHWEQQSLAQRCLKPSVKKGTDIAAATRCFVYRSGTRQWTYWAVL